MPAHDLECLHRIDQFQALQPEWDRFMANWFPHNYARSHTWLQAWWQTYHHHRPALVYLQRERPGGAIVAAAPLLIRPGCYGGFPVRSVQTIGSGIGCDDFLVTPESSEFIAMLCHDLLHNRSWDVVQLQRLNSLPLREGIYQALQPLGAQMELSGGEDYFVTFPASYEEYHRLRSRKFRRNMNQAINRLQREGEISIEVLNPSQDARRVQELGQAIAQNSWQFRSGKSHFNQRSGANFYTNLVRGGLLHAGEEFTVLLVGHKPVAYLLGCRCGNTYYAVDTAFHEQYRQVSAGRILFSLVFQRLINQGGISYFDFEGSGDYKDDYATDRRRSVSLTIYNRTFYSRCIHLVRDSSLYGRFKNLAGRRQTTSTLEATP